MKRKWLWFFTVLAMLFFTFTLAHAESVDTPSGTMVFPSSLRIIAESAFQGTAASKVILPDGTTHIGERAFADTLSLEAVYIPPSVKYIGADAFNGAKQLTVYGVSGSFADSWAREHGYGFIHEDIWISSTIDVFRRVRQASLSRGIEHDGQSFSAAALKWVGADTSLLTCPKEKPEMYPLDYDFP